ncbi:hypothetical protein [Mycolicibacterium tusciae]|uniref:hypothetical protein n=1 Tax=Mycolicibacterium tusciae TaxID=75922 RepID=UPI00024A2DAA|nr:hypothetical protein [Mycolicibacterium tusciae]
MITADDLQRLLAAEQKNATMVLVEGRIDVIGAGQLASPDYRGALEVVSREDLVKRLGEAPSDHDVAEQAGVLDAAISELGG